jgi:hypothetical protein
MLSMSESPKGSNEEPLKNLKESNPIEIVDYAVANRIDQEAAFAWWVPYTLRKRNRIVAAFKTWTTKKNVTSLSLKCLRQCSVP